MNPDPVAALASTPVEPEAVAIESGGRTNATGAPAGKTFASALDEQVAPEASANEAPGAPAATDAPAAKGAEATASTERAAAELAALVALLALRGPVAVAGEAGRTARPEGDGAASDAGDAPAAPVRAADSVAQGAGAVTLEALAATDVEGTAGTNDAELAIPQPEPDPEPAGESAMALESDVAQPAVSAAPRDLPAPSLAAQVASPRDEATGEDAGIRNDATGSASTGAAGAASTARFDGGNGAGDASHDETTGDRSPARTTARPADATPHAPSNTPPDLSSLSASEAATAAQTQTVPGAGVVASAANPSALTETVPVDAVPVHVEWLAARGGGTARIALDPPHLGPVDISVSVRGDRVEVVVHAGSEAANLLQGAREGLHQSMAGLDLRMDRFEVRALDPGSSDATGGGLSMSNGSQGGFARDATGDGRSPAEREALPRETRREPQRLERGAGAAGIGRSSLRDARGVDLRI